MTARQRSNAATSWRCSHSNLDVPRRRSATGPGRGSAPQSGSDPSPPVTIVVGGAPYAAPVRLTADLDQPERGHVEARLRSNLMAWLTTVDPAGRPSSVPVWFVLTAAETVLTYSQPGKRKLANLAVNPHVAFGLDVTDIGRSNVRIVGDAAVDHSVPPADINPDYATKYLERIAALFGTPERFAEQFSVPIVITPRRLLTGP